MARPSGVARSQLIWSAEELLERGATHASLDDAASTMLEEVQGELAPMSAG
ncbi:MAG: hypothetical protein ACE5GX_17595 [Thermoanaerobaculia bacterium]